MCVYTRARVCELICMCLYVFVSGGVSKVEECTCEGKLQTLLIGQAMPVPVSHTNAVMYFTSTMSSEISIMPVFLPALYSLLRTINYARDYASVIASWGKWGGGAVMHVC